MREAREVVPDAARRLLDDLGRQGIFEDFYLAGGTGLALLLAHRRSVDLDLFSRSNRLDFASRRALVTRLKAVGDLHIDKAEDGTFHGRVKRVRVSFFHYPQPLVRPLIRRGSLRIASMEDVGLMKIGAIIGRGYRKDFVDLYEICQRIPLLRLLVLGRRKFKDSRDFALQALKAIRYFEDADREPPVVSMKPLPWDRVKAFFTREVHAVTKRYLAV